jgi:hypothetical protein
VLGVEDELERMDRVLIASENWSGLYSKDPKTHAALIKAEARMIRKLRAYYIDLGKHAGEIIKGGHYDVAVKAAVNVNVIINDGPVDQAKGKFIDIMFDEIVTATVTGAVAGQNIYKMPLGIQSSDSVILQIAKTQVAKLVTQTSDTVKQNIRDSISDRLAQGKDLADATDALQDVIANPDRAELIAQTETVNSYGAGLDEFGKQSGAVGHEWEDVGADDVCADNSDMGPIPFEDSFEAADGSECRGPTAHPRCRCNKRLIYQNELDDDPNLFD